VIDVAILSVIRRWHFREGISVREIARRTKLARNTIAKYLASNVVQPRYVRRKSPSQLDAFASQLTQWLERNARQGRKQRRTLRQMHASLVALGYTGSYGRVAAFWRRWRQEQQELARTTGRGTFVPLTFAPGEAFQFDWSEDFAVIGGERTKLQIAHVKLSHSRAFTLRGYPLQTHEMLFDAHQHAFAVFGGVPRRGIYDNMKTAVDRVKSGKARDVNARFTAMVSHYLFEAQFCSPASGWEKGQIEKSVQDARHRLWPAAPTFATLDALNDWLQACCIALWSEVRHPEQPDRTIASVWEEERTYLMPVTQPFDGFVEHRKRVTPTCLVHVERNRYSVPGTYANRPVSVHLYAQRVVFVAEGQLIAEHPRLITRSHDAGRTIYDWRHYLCVVQRKPGALRNGAPFAELPEGFKRLQAILLKRPGGDREMVDILALVLHHDEQAVLTAVELALDAGAPSKTHVLNLLARLLGESPPAPIDAPPALMLQTEPQANAQRYDSLRRSRHAA
jgi:transposase